MSAEAFRCERMDLWTGAAPANAEGQTFRPYLTTAIRKTDRPIGAVLVCPGGGYGDRAPYEAEPVAEHFAKLGVHGFTVHYRVQPNRYPASLSDACQALRLIRQNAAKWNVDVNKIAILGFSAGGHLAASTSVLWPDANQAMGLAADDRSTRPDATILCYAVITSGKSTHGGSIANLLGERENEPTMRERVSLEKQVTKDTPTSFIWHTADDQAVPVENALLFAQALRDNAVPFELHVYPHGPHGMALGQTDAHVATWVPLAAEWLKGLGWK